MMDAIQEVGVFVVGLAVYIWRAVFVQARGR